MQEACGIEILPYRIIARWIEAFRQGREECHHRVRAGRPVAATDDLHFQAVRVLLDDDPGHVWRFPGNLGLQRRLSMQFMKKKHLCSYLLNIFLGRYYLLNVRNGKCIHKILLFRDIQYYRFIQQRLLNNTLQDYNCHH